VTDVVRVRLVGGFHVSLDDRVVAPGAWRLRKAKTLVKLLAVQPGHSLHRDQVVDVLWPDLDPAAARNNLHQVVHAARRALGTLGVDGPGALGLHDDVLTLGDSVQVVTDVEELDALAASAQETGRRDELLQALRDRPGELLAEDAYEPWVEAAAGSYRARRLQLVMGVVDALLADGSADNAVVLLAPVVAADPLNEPAQRAMMRALAGAGRRSEALVAYERLTKVLREELGSDPEPETKQLFRQLLTTGAEAVPVPGPRGAGNLPAAMTALIGRSRELAETRRILGRARLLTLTGMGGAGKSTLALELARQCVDDYSGEVHLVELAALTSGDQVATQLAGALRLALPSDSAPMDVLVAQLRRRRVLIVLDNCEHLLDACARVVTELLRGCPELSVLATSREALRVDGEVSWRLPSLQLPDPAASPAVDELAQVASVELFVQRAAAASPAFALSEDNAAAVAEICYRLDGIPLALELAAACVPVLSPRQIADRLEDALNLLRRGGRAAVTRQQTLGATLEWSYQLLDGDEQAVFRRLAGFAGSFTLDAVQAVCGAGLDEMRVLAALSRLVDTSLVAAEMRPDTTRYRLLETVRQYAVGQLRAAGEAADVSARHCAWFLRIAQAYDAERSSTEALDAWNLDVEHDNLRVALGWATHHRPADALELAASLWRYWLARGLFAEGRQWLEIALAGAPDPSPLRARALLALAVFDVRRGSGARLPDLADEAVQIHRGIGAADGLARTLHAKAVLFFMLGRWDESWQLTVESAGVAESAGAAEQVAAAHHLQALVLAGRGALSEARVALEALRASLLAIPAEVPRFLSPLQLGFAVDGAGTSAPRVHFEDTVLLGRLVGRPSALGYVLCNLADVLRTEERYDEALALLQTALADFADRNDRAGEALVYCRLGCLHRVRSEFDAGHEALAHSLLLRRGMGDRRAIGLTEANLAVLTADQGDLASGREQLIRVRDGFQEIEDIAGTVGVTLTLAAVEADAGDFTAAAEHLTTALRASADIPGNHRATAWGHLMHADVLARLGRVEQAVRERDEAHRRFRVLGVPQQVVDLRPADERLQSRR
jgi:predicted ATPase/DNA-binding SARP family transcriptional activator/predicted negative regulator of RcsB-dependent stress response